MRKKDVWRKILGAPFKEGDTIKFKWLDMRYSRGRPIRRTYCYGVVLGCLSDGDYIVHVIRGAKRGLLHVTKEEAEPWHPRKKLSIV